MCCAGGVILGLNLTWRKKKTVCATDPSISVVATGTTSLEIPNQDRIKSRLCSSAWTTINASMSKIVVKVTIF